MSRKFITQREIDFAANVTKELIQGVVGTEVRYYAIDIGRSDVNHLYEEAIHKSWRAPVAVNALASFDQQSTVAGRYSLDSRYSAEVYFHKKELDERNLVVREGDFIEWGGIFFEITSATEPQIFYGQINNKVMVKCVCVPAREGQFAAGGNSDKNYRTEKNIENTQGTPPVNPLNGPTTYAQNPFATRTSVDSTVYYGSAVDPGSYNSAFVTAFSSLAAVSAVGVGSLSFTVGSNQNLWIAVPSAWGLTAVSFIDAQTDFEAAVTLAASLTVNGISYDLWRSNRTGLGAVTIRMNN